MAIKESVAKRRAVDIVRIRTETVRPTANGHPSTVIRQPSTVIRHPSTLQAFGFKMPVLAD
jgi:hypothetical protein